MDTPASPNSSTVNSATSLTAEFSFNINHPVGNYDFSIWNTSSGITITKNNGFYIKPKINSNIDINIRNETVFVFPNPVLNVLYVKGINFGKIQIFDIIGNLRLESTSLEIDIKSLNKGIYILVINDGNKYYNRKIVIQ